MSFLTDQNAKNCYDVLHFDTAAMEEHCNCSVTTFYSITRYGILGLK